MSVLRFALGSGGAVELEVENVAVGAARADIPGLMRRSAETGRGFLIKNAKTQAGPSAILVDLTVFRDRIAQARPSRTLGEIVDSLPFHKLGKSPVLEARALPDDGLPDLALPEVDAKALPKAARGRR
ncbi:MAG: hypothetical protein LBI66_03470 [Burkholderiaceae bacterium]|jgi:hypothetical protein|nr:hypothetical protein [Burkholderiaceae bacterium]